MLANFGIGTLEYYPFSSIQPVAILRRPRSCAALEGCTDEKAQQAMRHERTVSFGGRMVARLERSVQLGMSTHGNLNSSFCRNGRRCGAYRRPAGRAGRVSSIFRSALRPFVSEQSVFLRRDSAHGKPDGTQLQHRGRGAARPVVDSRFPWASRYPLLVRRCVGRARGWFRPRRVQYAWSQGAGGPPATRGAIRRRAARQSHEGKDVEAWTTPPG